MTFPEMVQNLFLKYLGFEARLRDTMEAFDSFFSVRKKKKYFRLHSTHKPGGVYDTVMSDIKENPPEPWDERYVRAYFLRQNLSDDVWYLKKRTRDFMVLDCVALRKYLLLLELKGCEFAKCYGDRYTRSIKKYM